MNDTPHGRGDWEPSFSAALPVHLIVNLHNARSFILRDMAQMDAACAENPAFMQLTKARKEAVEFLEFIIARR